MSGKETGKKTNVGSMEDAVGLVEILEHSSKRVLTGFMSRAVEGMLRGTFVL